MVNKLFNKNNSPQMGHMTQKEPLLFERFRASRGNQFKVPSGLPKRLNGVWHQRLSDVMWGNKK